MRNIGNKGDVVFRLNRRMLTLTQKPGFQFADIVLKLGCRKRRGTDFSRFARLKKAINAVIEIFNRPFIPYQ